MKAGTASLSAVRVAANKAAAALQPDLRPLVVAPDEPYSARFVRAHSLKARMQFALWLFGPTRRLIYKFSEQVAPGFAVHLLLRKRFVEETLRTALTGPEPPRQVVIFGAGLDPLGVRLAQEFPAVPFIEIDHPSTQAVKRRALDRDVPPNLSLVPADLSADPVEERLRGVDAFHWGEKTFFIAEGLLMYLAEADVDRAFAAARRASSPGSLFVFTAIDTAVLSDPHSVVAETAVRMAKIGEPLLWTIDRRKLDGFLRKHGFRRRTVADEGTLRAAYLKPLGIERPLLKGEFIVVAEAN